MAKRKGKLNVSEISFIQNNINEMTIDDIANRIGRDRLTIYNYVKDNIGISPDQKIEMEGQNELRNKTYYKELLRQFSTEELELFNFHFKKMWAQFRDNVFHTEEMQIIDIIKNEILMNRNLRAQNESLAQIHQYESELAVEKMKGDGQDRAYVLNLERQIAVIRASHETLSRDYKDIAARKSSQLKEIRGTREQRIKTIEDSKKTFTELIDRLTTDPEYRKNVGLEMEKMKLATDRERKRLSEEMTYNDGVIDRPLLSAESVLEEDSE